MAPEQIRGQARQSSDQYALAVVVYEWLSGGSLFEGSFTEVCAQHIFATPQSLREVRPNISHEVEQVVMTALAKDPAQRFGSIRAFANALEQACRPAMGAFTNPMLFPADQPDLSPGDNLKYQTQPEIAAIVPSADLSSPPNSQSGPAVVSQETPSQSNLAP